MHSSSCTSHLSRSLTFQNVLEMILSLKDATANSMNPVFEKAYKKTNEMVASIGEDASYCGATVVSALLWKEEKSNDRRLTVANLGDSHCVLWYVGLRFKF